VPVETELLVQADRLVGGSDAVRRDQTFCHQLARPRLDFRYGPLATKLARHCNMSRRATFGLMHCKQGLPRSRGHRSCRDLACSGPVAATRRTRGKSVYPTTAAHKR
jgi:hypothetical protein